MSTKTIALVALALLAMSVLAACTTQTASSIVGNPANTAGAASGDVTPQQQAQTLDSASQGVVDDSSSVDVGQMM